MSFVSVLFGLVLKTNLLYVMLLEIGEWLHLKNALIFEVAIFLVQ